MAYFFGHGCFGWDFFVGQKIQNEWHILSSTGFETHGSDLENEAWMAYLF
jgi:hypothetical protein